ncbi:hypothetical protein BB029_18175 [Pseudomonas sp. S3E12]|nr:hypothetical protein BB029_18175 [Pseudomonas sp. S3E12]
MRQAIIRIGTRLRVLVVGGKVAYLLLQIVGQPISALSPIRGCIVASRQNCPVQDRVIVLDLLSVALITLGPTLVTGRQAWHLLT